MPVIDDIREQNKKIKGKGFKYAFSYLWEYYRIHALVIVLAILAIFFIVKTIVTSRDTGFGAIIVNAINAPSEEEFAEYIKLDTSKYCVSFDSTYKLATDLTSYDQNTYVNVQKIMAVVASKTGDVMLCDEFTYTRYISTGLYADLRDYFDEEMLNALGDKVIWGAETDTETGETIGEEYPMLINVSDAPKLENCYSGYTPYFAIIVNTEHHDYCIDFYNFIYNR